MSRSYHGRPFGSREMRSHRGPRRGTGHYRGRGGTERGGRGGTERGERPTEPCIGVSPDGNSLRYSFMGTSNFGDPSLVEKVIASRRLIGQYSEDSERNFVNDRSYLQFLLTKYLPDSDTKEKIVNIDLKEPAVEEELYTSTGSKDLENFLTWIINNKDIFNKEICPTTTSNEGSQFVMTKSVLGNLAALPYRINNAIKLYAYSFNGVIYMRKEYKVAEDDVVASRAHKFEQYMTEEDTSKMVICNEEFRAVISSKLGPHKIVYAAAMDCANPEEFEYDFTDLSSFVGLKCLVDAEPFNYRFQAMYWYVNYVLTGVPKILLGQRDANDVVTRLKIYEPSDMLQIGKEFWNPVNCLFFATKVLSFIKNKVESRPGVLFYIRKETGRPEITCAMAPETEKFLPEWFVQEILETEDAPDDVEHQEFPEDEQ